MLRRLSVGDTLTDRDPTDEASTHLTPLSPSIHAWSPRTVPLPLEASTAPMPITSERTQRVRWTCLSEVEVRTEGKSLLSPPQRTTSDESPRWHAGAGEKSGGRVGGKTQEVVDSGCAGEKKNDGIGKIAGGNFRVFHE